MVCLKHEDFSKIQWEHIDLMRGTRDGQQNISIHQY